MTLFSHNFRLDPRWLEYFFRVNLQESAKYRPQHLRTYIFHASVSHWDLETTEQFKNENMKSGSVIFCLPALLLLPLYVFPAVDRTQL